MTTGTTSDGAPEHVLTEEAAMEPRRDDGDDTHPPIRQREPRRKPQWSPVVTTGTTPGGTWFPACHSLPQWSPVVTTGTTLLRLLAGLLAKDAPQWSPVVTTGTTSPVPRESVWHGTAAMEPRRDDGDDVCVGGHDAPPFASRNGAPS